MDKQTVYTMECCATVKMNKVLTQAITWVSLENIMLTERGQT